MKPSLELLETRDCPSATIPQSPPYVAPLDLANDGHTVYLRRSDEQTGTILQETPTLIPLPKLIIYSAGQVAPDRIIVTWIDTDDPLLLHQQESFDGGMTLGPDLHAIVVVGQSIPEPTLPESPPQAPAAMQQQAPPEQAGEPAAGTVEGVGQEMQQAAAGQVVLTPPVVDTVAGMVLVEMSREKR